MKIAVLLDFLLGEGSISAAASFPMLFLDLFFVGLATVAGPSPAPPAAKPTAKKQKTNSKCGRLVPVAYNALSECERSEPKKNIAQQTENQHQVS